MKQFVESNYNAIFFIFLATITILSFLIGRQTVINKKGGEGIVFSCSESSLISQKIPISAQVAGASIDNTEPNNKTTESEQKGLYVGSKNGTKYYTPGCSGTNRIKPENYIWFQSIEDATLQGYTKGSC